MDADAPAGLAVPRRTKWLFALFLCPLCGLGFLYSVGGIALSGVAAALLAYNGAILWALGVLVVGVAASLVVWNRRKKAC